MQEHVTAEAVLERLRARYYRRKNAGLCPNCGEPSGDRVFCPVCRAMQYDCEKRQRLEREAQGLCKKCGRPLRGNDTKYKNCFRCRVKSAERTREWQHKHGRRGKRET